MDADEEREHLGVGLGAELAGPARCKLLLERAVILDHAVVHDGQLAAGVGVRMRVGLGRLAVRGPAGVADAERAVQRMLAQRAFELLDAPDALDDLQALAVEHGDAAGVIAAILQAAQSLQQQRLRLLVPQIRDDSTHSSFIPRGRESVKDAARTRSLT